MASPLRFIRFARQNTSTRPSDPGPRSTSQCELQTRLFSLQGSAPTLHHLRTYMHTSMDRSRNEIRCIFARTSHGTASGSSGLWATTKAGARAHPIIHRHQCARLWSFPSRRRPTRTHADRQVTRPPRAQSTIDQRRRPLRAPGLDRERKASDLTVALAISVGLLTRAASNVVAGLPGHIWHNARARANGALQQGFARDPVEPPRRSAELGCIRVTIPASQLTWLALRSGTVRTTMPHRSTPHAPIHTERRPASAPPCTKACCYLLRRLQKLRLLRTRRRTLNNPIATQPCPEMAECASREVVPRTGRSQLVPWGRRRTRRTRPML
ncbi:hypothetical protein LXA43DRAFT_1015715 [Ganoderma leucocontextum]|nr:hypothetical protein LXA43DRAFT_1015715 [Ganoderma leucocontextum]